MIIKVCGMREPDNIRAVEQLGTDWMGFILYDRSPRFVSRTPSICLYPAVVSESSSTQLLHTYIIR